MTNEVAERIQRLRQQLTKAPYLDLAPQPVSQQGLDYQLAQAQVDLASVQARAATSPSPEAAAQLKKAETRVKGLEGAVAKVRAELARLEALPACGPGRTIVPGAPPSRPPASPPSDRERNQSG